MDSGAGTTVTVQLAVLPLWVVAVMRVSPAAMPVTMPLSFTAAMLSSPEA